MEHLDTSVPKRIVVADFAASVSAAVIDKQQLKVRYALTEDALNARRKITFRVIDRNDDGKQVWICILTHEDA